MTTGSKTNNQSTRNDSEDSKKSSTNQQGHSQSNKGFASMNPEKQREIASEGGKASHKNDGSSKSSTHSSGSDSRGSSRK